MKFKQGKILLTRGIYHTITQSESFAQFVYSSLQRHIQGDWGECCSHDATANKRALKRSGRLFSVYQGKKKIWIITEWDRYATTVLYPEEY